jgi:hypothetical protein
MPDRTGAYNRGGKMSPLLGSLRGSHVVVARDGMSTLLLPRLKTGIQFTSVLTSAGARDSVLPGPLRPSTVEELLDSLTAK